MIDREQYIPGPANVAKVQKDGDKWTLVLVKELRHSPEIVWQAITDPSASARMGPLRRGWEPEYGWSRSEAHVGGNGAGHGDASDAS